MALRPAGAERRDLPRAQAKCGTSLGLCATLCTLSRSSGSEETECGWDSGVLRAMPACLLSQRPPACTSTPRAPAPVPPALQIAQWFCSGAARTPVLQASHCLQPGHLCPVKHGDRKEPVGRPAWDVRLAGSQRSGPSRLCRTMSQGLPGQPA